VVISAAWLIGDNLRVRRAYVAELEAKAARADTERAAEMQRAASEERSRIARELHDVVAHHVSVIAVQAGAARMLSEKEGNEIGAHQALAAVEASAREALGELRRLLGVLRHDDGEGPDLAPQPGLRQLPKLVSDVRLAGLPVELNVIGEPVPLPPALDLSAFRIVQEALTNVLKHEGSVPTSVIVRYLPDELEIDVIDSAPPRPHTERASSGRGLIGMQERVAMFGGELRAGPGASGGFEVRASMPLTQAGT
jgi:signal transduction histidine kinase